jgi:serine/threonine protein kinase
MSSVMKGVTRVHNYPVAVKYLNGSSEYDIAKMIGDQSYHFTRVFDFFCTDEKNILVSELVGCSLRKWVNNHKVTDHIIHQLIESMYHFHSSGYLHLDIKRDNFCVAYGHDKLKKPYIKIIDLGNTESIDQMKKSERQFMSNNPANASLVDEQEQQITPADEMEALGYMIWHIKYGRLPWEQCVDDKETRVTMKKDCRRNDKTPKEIREYLAICDNTPRWTLPDYGKLLSVLISPHSKFQLQSLSASSNPLLYDISDRYELCSTELKALLKFRNEPFDIKKIHGITKDSIDSFHKQNIQTMKDILEVKRKYWREHKKSIETNDLLLSFGLKEPNLKVVLKALKFVDCRL